MANAGADRSERAAGDWAWRVLAVLAAVAAVTAWRVAALWFSDTDLFVDESQYWFWGQELAFGYYSKPPLIGWVIRASTELGGSDATFWVRLPAPLFHAATALILGWIAAVRMGPAVGAWVAVAFVTLPIVSVGSALISTDTIMFPFFATALGLWLAVLDRGGPGPFAFAAGLALGVGFLGKYAAVYGILGAGLAALFVPEARPGWRAAGLALAGFALAALPNVAWNLANGLTTLQHTLDNVDWVQDPSTRAGLNLAGLGEFFLSQFIVFGPVFFAALVWLTVRAGGGDPLRQTLLWLSVPVVAVVCVQALLEEAFANWAAAAYLAGVLAVVPWLLARARAWLWASLALHTAFALALPAVVAFGAGWRVGPENRLLLGRYLGQAEMSREVIALARVHGGAVVVDDRAVLADLFYTGRDAGITVWAKPPRRRASDHYVFTRPLPPEVEGEVLFVARIDDLPEICAPAELVARLAPASGAYRTRPMGAWLVDAPCLATGAGR